MSAGLFGDDPESDKAKRAKRFREASATWAALYRERERRDYRWTPRCNKHLADTLNAIGDISFASIASAYLADRWMGYEGHDLRQLWRDLNKFIARAKPAEQRQQRFQDN